MWLQEESGATGAFRGEARLCEIITPVFLARKRRMEEREAKTAFTPRSRA
jgi:hypothetical protein